MSKKSSMSKVRRLGSAMLAVIASLVFSTAALAHGPQSAMPQLPQSPWKKAAPFPEPDEELQFSGLPTR